MNLIYSANRVTHYVKQFEQENPFPESGCGVVDIKIFQPRLVQGDNSSPRQPLSIEMQEQQSQSRLDKQRASTLHKSFYTLYQIHSN